MGGDTSMEEVRWATYEAIQLAQRSGQPGAQEGALQTLSAQFAQAVRAAQSVLNAPPWGALQTLPPSANSPDPLPPGHSPDPLSPGRPPSRPSPRRSRKRCAWHRLF